jgi:hypothetical protein
MNDSSIVGVDATLSRIVPNQITLYYIYMVWCGQHISSSTHVNDFADTRGQLEKVTFEVIRQVMEGSIHMTHKF